MSIKLLVQKFWGHRVMRFVTIGLINTITDLTILNTLVFATHLRAIYANLISASISISLSYFWNHHFVFKHKNPVSIGLFIRFFVITGFGILVIQSLVILGVEHLFTIKHTMSSLGVSYNLAKLITINGAKLSAVVISMVWNFFLYTFAVFKEDKEEEGVVPY